MVRQIPVQTSGATTVVEVGVPQQGGGEILIVVEVMGLQDLADAPVEAFRPPIGLRVAGRAQAVFDASVGASVVENLFAGGAAVAVEAAVGEFGPVVGEACLDSARRGLEEGLGGTAGAVLLQRHKDPSRGAVDGDEEVLSRFAAHRGAVFDINVEEARLIRLEGVHRRRLRGESSGVAVRDTLAAPAAIHPRAGHRRVKELPDHCEKVVPREPEALPPVDDDGFLGWGQSGLQPMRSKGGILHRIPPPPLLHGGTGQMLPPRQGSGARLGFLEFLADRRRGPCPRRERNFHAAPRCRDVPKTSRSTLLAMNRG